ncbi:hypothetical protein Mgra_00003057 [Meloidogyne graminicola]|uniref:SH3 domain-containing protein n=1 Tax=Meloidogyne graminicola TaxID=189291 RepID=A0A8S9ZX69_9BILA|nr:hypothetical protein Mgra_00003057 [Meloidogyne graminicola]
MENPYGTTTVLSNNYYLKNNNSSLSPLSDSVVGSEQQKQPQQQQHLPLPFISSSPSHNIYNSSTLSSPSSHYHRPSSLNNCNNNNYDGGRGGGLYRANQLFCCPTSGTQQKVAQQPSGLQQVAEQQIALQQNVAPQPPYKNVNKQNGLLISEENNANNRFSSTTNNNNNVDHSRPPFIPKKPVFYSNNNINGSNYKNDAKKNERNNLKNIKNEENEELNNSDNNFLQQMQHSPKMKYSSKLSNNNNNTIYSLNCKKQQNLFNNLTLTSPIHPPLPLPHLVQIVVVVINSSCCNYLNKFYEKNQDKEGLLKNNKIRTEENYFPVREGKEKTEQAEFINNKLKKSNSFLFNSDKLSSSTTEAAALVTADLRARFCENKNNNEKRNFLINQQQQRRYSFVGTILNSQQELVVNSTIPTISSFGCSDAGKTREGRIYATAGFGAAAAARNRKKKLKANENKINEFCEEENVKMRKGSVFSSQTCLNNDINQLNCSNLINNKNSDCNSIGAFSLGNDFSYGATTSGKSTLGRRAQKLAQRAAIKLRAELSNSASAIYALFSGGNNSEKILNGENKLITESDDFLFGNKKKKKIRRREVKINEENNISTGGYYWMDKTTLVSKHTAKGIKFLDSFSQFIKERSQIEEEYATKLKNLTKKSRGKKSSSDDEFTSSSAFHSVLGELESLASQHELISERLRDVLLPQISDKSRQFCSVRKKHSQTHLEAQEAFIKYTKADENRYLSRHDVDKAKMTANNKSTICEQGKQNYAAQLSSTNQAKNDFYNILLPKLLEEMRQLEIERIDFTRQIMLESVKAETDVFHIIQRCYEDMNKAINTINPEHDTLLLVEQTKTGYAHPADFEFEDLGSPKELSADDTTSFDGSTIRRIGAKNINGKGIPRKHSLKLFNNSIVTKFSTFKSNGNSLTSGSHTSSGSNIGEYGNLPPQQRCRRIQKKLEDLSNELNIKENSKDGLEKLISVYNNDPNMGDPKIVKKQIENNQCEIDALNEQIARFKNILLEAQSELNQPLGGGGNNPHLNTTTNSTISSSSPTSSPRGSACSGGVSRLNGLNGNTHHCVGERGSYSEASSISSAEGASSLQGINGGAPRLLQTSTQQTTLVQPISSSQTITVQQTSTSSSAAITPVTSAINIKNNINDVTNNNNNSGDFYEECDGPNDGTNEILQNSDIILGTALARYHYNATPDEAGGTIITMNEGDELLLLERDMGDGWTRVRHRISNSEGFVPTSYLECKWYGASTALNVFLE